MRSVNKTNSHAFTLVELVVVILIMGIVYSMVATNFTSQTKTTSTLGVDNLTAFMRTALANDKKNLQEHVRTFYVYGNECQDVAFDPSIEDFQFDKLAFSRAIKAYTFDAYGTLRQKEFAPLEVDNSSVDVCFAYTLYVNGSGNEYVVENAGSFYYMPSFFGSVQRFESKNEARDAMLKTSINPHEVRLR